MSDTAKIREKLLVIRCIEGDRQAFDEIVDLWQQRLFRHAYQLTADEDAAWDAVQETWAAIVSNIRKIRDPGAFGGWAYRILGAKCANWVRMRQRQRRLAGELIADAETGEPPHTESIVLREALAKLSFGEREILSLRYGTGYDTAEIAELLMIPEGTVKSRLHRAREEVRRLMEGRK